MKKIFYKSKIIQAVIIMAAVGIILTFFPLRWWNETVKSSVSPATEQLTGPIDDNRMLMQSFVAQYDHLGSVRIYLGGDTSGESFYVRMLNPEYQQMFEETVAIDPANLPGFYEIMVDLDTQVGETYYLILQGKMSAEDAPAGEMSYLYVSSGEVSLTDYPFLGPLYYADETVDGVYLTADYRYTVPLRKGMVAVLTVVVLLAAALALYLVHDFYHKHPERDKLMTVERAVKFICNPVIAIGMVIGLGAVLFQAFADHILDNTFFFISILLLGGILFYAVNHQRDARSPLITKAILREKWPDYLQSVMFAGAFAACCEYMCALYNIHHSIAERKEVIFFGLALIVMMSKKEIFSLYNLIYMVAAGIYGYHFYTGQAAANLTSLERLDLKLSIWATLIAGIVVLNVLTNLVNRLVKKEMKPWSWRYGGLIALFFVLSLFFRNGRFWTIALVVSFTLYSLQYGTWRKGDILTNICRGIVLQFIWATGDALLHRPFATFRTVRYTHIFHTVTITATYLMVVECASLVILLTKLRKSRKLRDIWKECLLFGVVTSYMLFTMARTGFFAVAVMGVFAVLLIAAGKRWEKLRNILASVGIMMGAVIVCFPVTFFLQRTIPALVSEPRTYEIESYPDEVMRGRQVGSFEFMRVGRFIEVFADKVFNIPEGTLDIYGDIKNYDATHFVVNGAVVSEAEVKQQGLDTTQTVAERKEIDAAAEAAGEESHEWSSGPEIAPTADYSNGRTDIFRAYIWQLNMTGHPKMGAQLPDGSLAGHAHNIFLQFAYDHGIFMGMMFIMVGLATFFKGLMYFRDYQTKINYAALPAVITVAVGMAGMAEWIFHFSNPAGFALMLMIAPLIFEPCDNVLPPQ